MQTQTSNRSEAECEVPMLNELQPAFEFPGSRNDARSGLENVPAGGEDDLPVGIRIALAVGLRPGEQPRRTRRKFKAEQELALVGGLARTLARGPGADKIAGVAWA